jgi:hypothetical protein
MTQDAKTPRPGVERGVFGLSSLGGIDGPENKHPNRDWQAAGPSPAVKAACLDLKRDYAVEAAFIASRFAAHFAEQFELRSPIAAEYSMRAAIVHIKEAAKAFREWQRGGTL